MDIGEIKYLYFYKGNDSAVGRHFASFCEQYNFDFVKVCNAMNERFQFQILRLATREEIKKIISNKSVKIFAVMNGRISPHPVTFVR